jgi:hypothetical protein
VRVHIHCFGAIAPATGYGNGGTYSFAFEFLGTMYKIWMTTRFRPM